MDKLIKQAKIYMIYDNTNGNVYYGSTKKTLKQRLSTHKKQNSGCISIEILKNNNYIIKEIETIYYIHYHKVLWREKYYIQKYPCINKNSPIRTYEERKEYDKEYYELNRQIINEKAKENHKEYYELNKDKIKEKVKEYREANKDKIKEKAKEYREENKEHLKEQKKEYREANRQIINEKAKEKITCECGCIVRKGDIARHKKSNRHKNNINP